MKVLQVENVTVNMNQRTLLQDISFDMEPGEVTALVGHNGAGKSTMMKTIMGMYEYTKGDIMINETYHQHKSFITFKQLVSYLPEEPLLLTELTVMQHFQLYGKSYQIAENKLHDLIEEYTVGFDLQGKLDEYPEALSKGMRQKVQTICSFLPDTPLLLIDEPFMGLDIFAVDYFEALLKRKMEQGTSILITTHQLDRMKDFASSFILLQHGVIKNKGPIEAFETITRTSES